MRFVAAVALGLVLGCEPGPTPAPDAAATKPAPATPALPWKAAAIAHGGQGSSPAVADGCRAAVDAALAELERSGDPAQAAVAGVVVLEDDPRFNAGTGSVVRIDGRSVQMDAAVMRSDGRFGAVAGIEEVKNPVKVARAVMDTPHLLLAGDGATQFARTLGMAPYDPRTPERMAKARDIQGKLLAGDPSLPPAWKAFDWRARWNFPTPLAEIGLADGGTVDGSRDASRGGSPGGASREAGHDTVGVAVRGPDGRFGVALSTGGTSITLRGRVGDVPILGAGLYAGSHGAAACTGTGERVVEHGTARKVEAWLADGASAQEAANRAVEEVGATDLAIIVIDPVSVAAGVGPMGMGWAAREAGSSAWKGPTPAAPSTSTSTSTPTPTPTPNAPGRAPKH